MLKYAVVIDGTHLATSDKDAVTDIMNGDKPVSVWVAKNLATMPKALLHIGNGLHIAAPNTVN